MRIMDSPRNESFHGGGHIHVGRVSLATEGQCMFGLPTDVTVANNSDPLHGPPRRHRKQQQPNEICYLYTLYEICETK
jgi:hypothetical protein